MIAFIDGHRCAYGAEPICRVLPIAPSTYYDHQAKRADPSRLSARARRDGELRPEIKRVFVAEEHRGNRLATAVMQHLEEYLLSIGVSVVRLEAGPLQPKALSLYRKLGYAERGPFGSYRVDPLSVFMEKTLHE